jgi:hypothetical protein
MATRADIAQPVRLADRSELHLAAKFFNDRRNRRNEQFEIINDELADKR